jgi:hypothetical protein
MTRTATAIVTGALTLWASAAANADIISAGADQAERCMSVFIQTNVAPGVAAGNRDFLRRPVNRDAIVKDAVANCEPALFELVLHFQPGTDKAALHASVVKEANRLFDLIQSNARN